MQKSRSPLSSLDAIPPCGALFIVMPLVTRVFHAVLAAVFSEQKSSLDFAGWNQKTSWISMVTGEVAQVMKLLKTSGICG